MRFLLFSDLHYYPGVWDGGTFEDLELLQRRALENNCDFMIHAGDFAHGKPNADPFIEAYNNFSIPSYHCLGNHDSDWCTIEETLSKYKMPNGYYYFDCKGYRMIIVDPNYLYHEGEYIHFSGIEYRYHGAERDFVPPEQLAWLEKTIAESPYPCILISHESFERPDGVQNRAEVLKIINEANRRKPGTVLMCINGHYHRDNIRILDNVCYFDMNSASFEWIDGPHNLYPEEEMKAYSHSKYTLIYDNPLHAIVTIEGNTITIEGMESTMRHGITRAMTDNPLLDPAGREMTPTVQSAEITLG